MVRHLELRRQGPPEPNTTRDPLLQLHEWWAYLPQYGGYVSNIYMGSTDNQLPGVARC
ncbi:hypothetical protein ABT249_02535 [Streptomyces griseorubiginosus]